MVRLYLVFVILMRSSHLAIDSRLYLCSLLAVRYRIINQINLIIQKFREDVIKKTGLEMCLSFLAYRLLNSRSLCESYTLHDKKIMQCFLVFTYNRGGLEKLDRGISDKAALNRNRGYQA